MIPIFLTIRLTKLVHQTLHGERSAQGDFFHEDIAFVDGSHIYLNNALHSLFFEKLQNSKLCSLTRLFVLAFGHSLGEMAI